MAETKKKSKFIENNRGRAFDTIPTAVQSLWCQFLTGNEILTAWGRVSKSAKRAADSPLSWRETVVINIYVDVRALERRVQRNKDTRLFTFRPGNSSVYRCKVLDVRGRSRSGTESIVLESILASFVRPSNKLCLEGIEFCLKGVPDSITCIETGARVFDALDARRFHKVNVVHYIDSDGSSPFIFMGAVPNLKFLDVRFGRKKLTGWDKFLLIENIPPTIERISFHMEHAKQESNTYEYAVSRARDYIEGRFPGFREDGKTPKVIFDMGNCRYIPLPLPLQRDKAMLDRVIAEATAEYEAHKNLWRLLL